MLTLPFLFCLSEVRFFRTRPEEFQYPSLSFPKSFIGDPYSFFYWIPAFAGMTHQEILTKQNEDTLPQDDTYSVILSGSEESPLLSFQCRTDIPVCFLSFLKSTQLSSPKSFIGDPESFVFCHPQLDWGSKVKTVIPECIYRGSRPISNHGFPLSRE